MSTTGLRDLIVEFTDDNGRQCNYDPCSSLPWGQCSKKEQQKWGCLRNKCGEVRWFCGEHVRYYISKGSTARRSEETSGTDSRSQHAGSSTTQRHLSVSLSNKSIHNNVAAAQRGAGRARVEAVGNFEMASTSGPIIDTGSESYKSKKSSPWPSRRASGYDADRHGKFRPELSRMAEKVAGLSDLGPLKVRELISLKAIAVVMLPVNKKAALKATPVGESCMEGTSDIDAHIGGTALHRVCYDLIKRHLHDWSYGFPISITRTTLRPAARYAPIAGYACDIENKKVKEKDAIWDFFYTKRGKAKEPSFKAFELELHVCLELEDYNKALEHRESHKPQSWASDDSELKTNQIPLTTTGSLMRGKKRIRSPTPPLQFLESQSQDATVGKKPGPKRARTAAESSQSRFVSPEPDEVRNSLRSQTRIPRSIAAKAFLPKYFCTFYEIPVRTYGSVGFPKSPLALESLNHCTGWLEINTDPTKMLKGANKTAHPGKITFTESGTGFAPFSNPEQMVCVKSPYKATEDEPYKRSDGITEVRLLMSECACLDFATILLDLTYSFISREIDTLGQPEFQIPDIRFIRAMLAVSGNGDTKRAFFIEEWLDSTSGYGWVKYINNREPRSIVPPALSQEAHDIAEFLCFAQHVQWQKTGKLAFTSDFQGNQDLLTDPQILTDPELGPVLFASGNVARGFTEFRVRHECNRYCKFFNLSLEVGQDT